MLEIFCRMHTIPFVFTPEILKWFEIYFSQTTHSSDWIWCGMRGRMKMKIIFPKKKINSTDLRWAWKAILFYHIVLSRPCIIFTNWRDCMPSTVDVGEVEAVIIIININIIVCTEYFAKISKSPATKNYESLHHVNSKHAHHAAYSGFLRPKLTATTITAAVAIYPATGWKMKTENHIARFTCTLWIYKDD